MALHDDDLLLVNDSQDGNEAKKMILKTVDGVQFLLVEKGEFDKVPKGVHCGYHGYKKK